MKPLIALVVCAIFVRILFWLNKDRSAKTSSALLLPFFWLLIAGSRNVGEWLQMGAPSEGDAYTEGNALDRNLLMAVIAVGIIVLFQRRHVVARILRSNWAVVLYFSYCLISLAWSDYMFVGFKRWIRAIGDVTMVLLILSDRNWLAARQKFYAWSAFMLIPASILLIRYFPQLGRSYGLADGKAYWTGVATGKNELGMICMVVGVASVAVFIDTYRREKSKMRTRLLLAHGAVVAMVVWLIHMADSATSLACFALGSTVVVLTTWRPFQRRNILVHALVWSLVFVAFAALFLNLGSGMVQNLGRDSTLTGRTDLWAHILKLVDDPILGTGYENFWIGSRLQKLRDFTVGVNQAHNGYLEVYLNLGWVGVAFLATLILRGYRNVIAAYRRNPDIARLQVAYFVIALAYNFTEGAFKFRNPVWISFLLATMTVPQLLPARETARVQAPDRTPQEQPIPEFAPQEHVSEKFA